MSKRTITDFEPSTMRPKVLRTQQGNQGGREQPPAVIMLDSVERRRCSRLPLARAAFSWGLGVRARIVELHDAAVRVGGSAGGEGEGSRQHGGKRRSASVGVA